MGEKVVNQKDVMAALIHLSKGNDEMDIHKELPNSLLISRDPNFTGLEQLAHDIQNGKIAHIKRFNTFLGIEGYTDIYGKCLRRLFKRWRSMRPCQRHIIFGAFWEPVGEQVKGDSLSLLVSDLLDSENFDVKLLDSLIGAKE